MPVRGLCPEAHRPGFLARMTAYRGDIDGLRAIAAAGVVVWHAEFFVGGRPLLPGGFLGVDVFLVVSGFLITSILMEGTQDDSFSLTNFWVRRIKRIVPMLLVTVLLSTLVAYWLMAPDQRADVGQSAVSASLAISNIQFSLEDSYWSEPAKLRPLLHTWTLGLEIQFYLLFPIILRALRRTGTRRMATLVAVLAATSFGLAVVASQARPEFAFYNLPTRFWEFGLGALVAILGVRAGGAVAAPVGVIGIGLIVGAFFFASSGAMHPGPLTLLPVVGTGMVIISADSWVRAVLSWAPIRLLGLVSYSVYLIHQPLFAFSRVARDGARLGPQQKAWLTAATLVLAVFAYLLVERPFRRRSHVGFNVALGFLGVLAVGVGALAALSGGRNAADGLTRPPERWIVAIDGATCQGNDVQAPCPIGVEGRPPDLALLGDSHALALSGALDEALRELGLAGVVYTMNGCPFIEGVLRTSYPRPCDEHLEEVFAALDSSRIGTVIIHDRRNAYMLGSGGTSPDGVEEPGDFAIYPVELGEAASALEQTQAIESLQLKTLRRLRDGGVSVVLILPVPEMGVDVGSVIARRVAEGRLPVGVPLEAHQTRLQPVLPVMQAFSSDPRVLVLDPSEAMCANGFCAAHGEDAVWYADSNHLSREGAELVVGHFREDLIQFLGVPGG